jgi:endonuclease/exonuclease/phosphatase family metal-dependent hydrolase
VGLFACGSAFAAPLHGTQQGTHAPSPSGAAGMTGRSSQNGSPSLRVLTLNAAHGRSTAPNQLLLGARAFHENLAAIGRVLADADADVVALQEADGPSRWSGGFDHVARLADGAAYAWGFRADHASNWLYRYGTAVLSRLPLNANQSHRFDATPFRPRKGFVLSEVRWPGADGPGRGVDVVSVHLDFASQSARRAQLRQLLGVLEERSNPLVVLGDFNSEWHEADSTVRQFARTAGLSAFEPEATHHATYGDQRLDWVLISSELRFDSYAVLPDVVSDHRAVLDAPGAQTARRASRAVTSAARAAVSSTTAQ